MQKSTDIFEVDSERLTKFAYYMIAAYTDSVASRSDIKIDTNNEQSKDATSTTTGSSEATTAENTPITTPENAAVTSPANTTVMTPGDTMNTTPDNSTDTTPSASISNETVRQSSMEEETHSQEQATSTKSE